MDILNMPVINIVICIVITWALFAIVCSVINEAIVQVMAERGRFMKKYILQQLQDRPNGVNWGYMLYNHGTIDLLSRTPEKPTNQIDSKLFAEVILDVVGNAAMVTMLKPEVEANLSYTHPSLRGFQAATMVLKPSDVVSFFKQALMSAELNVPIVDGKRDEALVYAHLITGIETWYNSLQGRITLWYKKRTSKRLFIMGVVLAFILNIDTIQLFSVYQKNPATTEALIGFYSKNQQYLSDIATKLDTTKLVLMDADTNTIQNATVRHQLMERLAKKEIDTFILSHIDSANGVFLMKVDSLSKSLNLPIGYKYSIFSCDTAKAGKETDGSIIEEGKSESGSSGYLFFKLIGYLISAFAASFGAPFWFEFLKKFTTKKI